jgi:hypothetical protein
MIINCFVSRNKQREIFAAQKRDDKDEQWKMFVENSNVSDFDKCFLIADYQNQKADLEKQNLFLLKK